MVVDPAEVFQGVILLAAPHMDDGVLACGATIARLSEKERVHVIYATDGSRSPIPMFPWSGTISPDLAAIRMQEARQALNVLGISQEDIHFLGFPDGQLKERLDELSNALARCIRSLEPAHVMIPFRYDRHPDHLALNCATAQALQSARCQAKVTEYFVYYRWRLLPGGDIRRFIRPDHLLEFDVRRQSAQKRKALDCFRSQTTLFFDWQDRPILPAERLNEVSNSPELFLQHDPDFPGATIFAHARTWIRLIHTIEPPLKNRKDQMIGLIRTGMVQNGRQSE